MTTPAVAAQYLNEFIAKCGNEPVIYNPHGKPVMELPVIYGFNNGGPSDWLEGVLLAEDGTYLGGHICSHEGYMPGDLGVVSGWQDKRHEAFRLHYPDGYRMDFVGHEKVLEHAGLADAMKRNAAAQDAAQDAARSA
jgi:hypothetical protein